jgi:hypothetical protein
MISRFSPTRAGFYACVYLLASLLSAQLTGADLSVDNVTKGSMIVSAKSIPIRDQSPKLWPFYSKGTQIAVSPPGQALHVLGEKTVPTLLGDQKWIYVKPAGNSAQPMRAEGWVYLGPKGGTSAGFSAAVEN